MIDIDLLRENIIYLKDATLIVAFNNTSAKSDWWLTQEDPEEIFNIMIKAEEIPSTSRRYTGVLSLPGSLLFDLLDTCITKDLKSTNIEIPFLEKLLDIPSN